MDPSFRIVPASAPKSASVAETSNSLGLHDTLRYGPRTIATEIKTEGGLKDRLHSWEETQDNMKLTMLRNTQGLHAPMRMLMERKLVSANPHMPILPQTNLQLDILMGRDEAVETSDVFLGPLNGPPLDIRHDMEKKHRI
ncbi:proteasome maturation factor UMP1-domain-containing protein [Rhodocollybia butyracea]|uniref:Proteasome maturation factor UMP1-domain-containing protein n=1 Tax=Rhodocollybia butyracea TaxID=206335 RepID=A0A9P5UB31_9AGAR|nr:proteasome maturation factor UMP1-domain-containing protein [Rhodocollybia butyracea]